MASLLLAAGEPGHRRSLPNSRIMVHQPSGGASVRCSGFFFSCNDMISYDHNLGLQPAGCVSVRLPWGLSLFSSWIESLQGRFGSQPYGLG